MNRGLRGQAGGVVVSVKFLINIIDFSVGAQQSVVRFNISPRLI